jgi:hypothetical protein
MVNPSFPFTYLTLWMSTQVPWKHSFVLSLKSNIKPINHYWCDIMKHAYDIMFLTGIHISHITTVNKVSDSNKYLIIWCKWILSESGTCEYEEYQWTKIRYPKKCTMFQYKGFTSETLCLLTHFKCKTYVLKHHAFCWTLYYSCWSQWARVLRQRSAATQLLRLWVWIPPVAWIFVCCECCVYLCNELITHPEEFYRLWFTVVCDLQTSRMRKP